MQFKSFELINLARVKPFAKCNAVFVDAATCDRAWHWRLPTCVEESEKISVYRSWFEQVWDDWCSYGCKLKLNQCIVCWKNVRGSTTLKDSVIMSGIRHRQQLSYWNWQVCWCFPTKVLWYRGLYISSGDGKKRVSHRWTANYLYATVCRTVKDAAGITWSVGTDQGDSNNSSSVSICWTQLLGDEACQESSQGVHVGNSNELFQLNNCCWKVLYSMI